MIPEIANRCPPDEHSFPFEAGVVRLTHPAVLKKHGATHAGVDDARAVRGPHLFVMAATKSREAVLAVIHSTGGIRRIAIPPKARTGHPAWLNGPSYLSLHQLWFASQDAIEEAARAAGDASWPHNPNRITATWVRNKLWWRFQQLGAYRCLLARAGLVPANLQRKP